MMKLTARSVVTRHSVTLFGDEGLAFLSRLLKDQKRKGNRTFLLADTNTEKYCLPLLREQLAGWQPDHQVVIPEGEKSKSLITASKLWEELASLGADRHALLLNLGGGVVTDLGGYMASCFKRGIRFVHIPTTLTGMADAAIGGKTAINLEGVKNQVGTFCLPEAVVIHPAFLKTLDAAHLRSGLAEIVKCALVADARLWKWLMARELKDIAALPASDPAWLRLVKASAAVKHRIIRIDFEEKKERKLLNFGHTFGHAFESLMMKKGKPVSHGEAVAMGMIWEAWLSMKTFGLVESQFREIAAWLVRGFGFYTANGSDIETMTGLMLHDKKNIAGTIRFTGIVAPGKGKINGELTEPLIRQALQENAGRQ
jgi:3-dehydroquinate synthase